MDIRLESKFNYEYKENILKHHIYFLSKHREGHFVKQKKNLLNGIYG